MPREKPGARVTPLLLSHLPFLEVGNCTFKGLL